MPADVRSPRKRTLGAGALALALATGWPYPASAASIPVAARGDHPRPREEQAIVIDRAALDAAESAVLGAKGAYDPFLEVEGGWRRIGEPANSVISGAPAGELGTTTHTPYVNASVTQLFSTCATASLQATTDRQGTNNTFVLLTPAYDTRLGVGFTPLLRNRAVDPARSQLHAARRSVIRRCRAAPVSDTVAAVEGAPTDARRVRRTACSAVRAPGGGAARRHAHRAAGGVAPGDRGRAAWGRAGRRRRSPGARVTTTRAENALKI
jgi:hypothetical protein